MTVSHALLQPCPGLQWILVSWIVFVFASQNDTDYSSGCKVRALVIISKVPIMVFPRLTSNNTPRMCKYYHSLTINKNNFGGTRGMANYQSPPQYQPAPGTSSDHYQQGSLAQHPYTSYANDSFYFDHQQINSQTSGQSANRHRKTNTFGQGDLPTHQTLLQQSGRANYVDEEDEDET